MRRNLMLALALAAVLSLGVAAVASAVSITLRAGDLVTTFGGTTSPKALSKTKYTPVTTNIFGKISTSDGTHAPAFREAVVDIDKDVKLPPYTVPGGSAAIAGSNGETRNRSVPITRRVRNAIASDSGEPDCPGGGSVSTGIVVVVLGTVEGGGGSVSSGHVVVVVGGRVVVVGTSSKGGRG